MLELLHPKVVHIPIALAVLMPLLSGALLLAWWRGALPRRAWLVALGMQAILVGGAALALQTGEVDEERVEEVVPEAALEAHEEAAEIFLWVAVATLAIAAVVPFLKRESVAQAVAAAAVAATLAVLALGVRVGEAGGALVYEHGAASAFTGSSQSPAIAASRGDGDDDDDD